MSAEYTDKGGVGRVTTRKSDGMWTYFTRALTRNYFQFKGRARRMEYWGFTLFSVLVYVLASIVDAFTIAPLVSSDPYGRPGVLSGLFSNLWLVYCLIPSIAITVRRLHDQNMTGWLYLIVFIPILGGVVMFILMLFDSTKEPNKHGPSPKYGVLDIGETFA